MGRQVLDQRGHAIGEVVSVNATVLVLVVEEEVGAPTPTPADVLHGKATLVAEEEDAIVVAELAALVHPSDATVSCVGAAHLQRVHCDREVARGVLAAAGGGDAPGHNAHEEQLVAGL